MYCRSHFTNSALFRNTIRNSSSTRILNKSFTTLFVCLFFLTRIDIDECASGVNDCHGSALCTNTVGSFNCSCNNPYTGDGKTCNLVTGN